MRYKTANNIYYLYDRKGKTKREHERGEKKKRENEKKNVCIESARFI